MKDLRKIKEGMSGEEAATVIYMNDSDLYDKVEACRQELEANKAYVAQINAGGKTDIQVKSFTGTSETDVMSQAAVTSQVSNINGRIDNAAMLADAEITEDTHDGPNVAIVNAKYATQASYDMQGHELSSYFYRLNDLDTRLKEVEKFNARLVKIEGRLDVIEATLKQLGA